MKLLLPLFTLIFIVACLDLSEDSSEVSYPSEFVDARDGHTYKVVKIGEQVWMAENLALEADSLSFCFDNLPSNCDVYGRLYPWDVVVNGEKPTKVEPLAQQEVQGICPEGWRVPSMWDFKELGAFVSKELGYEEFEYGYYDIGYALKAVGAWLENDPADNRNWGPTVTTDEYGFGALPGGSGTLRDSLRFYYSNNGNWWSSTEMCDNTADYLGMSGYGEFVHSSFENIYWGKPRRGCGSEISNDKLDLKSVRCLKN